MTAATGQVFNIKPAAESVVKNARYPLAANVVPGKHWLLGIDPTTGNAVAQAAGVTGLVSAGFSDRNCTTSATAGLSFAIGRQEMVSGFPSSTGTLDIPLAADIAVPAWAVDNQTVGKLSNYGGVNRSLLGLLLGIDPDNNTPFFLPGPIGWLLGRIAMMADGAAAGLVAYPVDASATTSIGSTTVATAALIIPRAKTHGVLTSVEIVPSAALAATSGNNRTITVWKIDSLGVAAAVSVATFVTTTALVAQTAAAFTLSAVAGALNLLETDILAYSTVYTASGAVIPQSAIRANMKVL
jgi:hypothetical protein